LQQLAQSGQLHVAFLSSPFGAGEGAAV